MLTVIRHGCLDIGGTNLRTLRASRLACLHLRLAGFYTGQCGWNYFALWYFRTYSLEYLPLRFWIGMWTGFFLLIMVATDASYLVRYITRFTEEGFAALISFIFIYESLEKLIAIKKTQNVCVLPMDCPRVYYAECLCNMTNKLIDVDGTNATQRWCLSAGGTLIGPGCRFTPDVLFFSVILFFATYFLASKLKGFRTEPFFPAKVRVVAVNWLAVNDSLSAEDLWYISPLHGFP